MRGFIGSHLATALKERDILPIGIPHDLLYDLPALLHFVQQHEPQYIVSLHSYGNHGQQTEEDKIIMANYFATWNLLKATSFTDYKAFINVATSSQYGKREIAMNEIDNPRPDTFYAAAKAGAMYLCRAYAMQYKKPIATVIPFSIYGEGEADFRLIPTICRHIITGETMPFVSKPTHDWTHVSDFINGVLTVVDNIEKVTGEAVNIGTGQATSNIDVAKTLTYIAEKGFKHEERYKEQPHHSSIWLADNTKLKALGWSQKTTLEKGLYYTWQYYEAKYAGKVYNSRVKQIK